MVIQSVSTYETSSNSPSFTFAPAIPIVGYTIIKHQNQMQVLEEIKVSVYENVYSKKPKIMSFLEVIFFLEVIIIIRQTHRIDQFVQKTHSSSLQSIWHQKYRCQL